MLIAGDAAGMCMNLGFTIRGMDLAISAGEAAAKTVLSAMKRDDFSKQSLGEYRQHLDDGPMRDMRMYQKLPAFLDNPRMFTAYPEMAVSIARDLFTVDGSAPVPMRKNPAPCEESGLHQPDERWPERSDRIMTSPVNVDVKLGVNKFNVDEDSPHIILKTDPDKQALEVLIKACPAGLYKSRTTAAYGLITPDARSAERAAFSGSIQRWKSGNTRVGHLAWSFATVNKYEVVHP